jgi:hypothetical protein
MNTKQQKTVAGVMWFLKILAAIILLQTLFFKFTGQMESIELFSRLQIFGLDESIGRIGVGIAELLISILLLIPRTALLGALGVIGLMLGALYFHIAILGFTGPDGQLVAMALVALVSAVIVFVHEVKRKGVDGIIISHKIEKRSQ